MNNISTEIEVSFLQREDLRGLKELYEDAFGSETDLDKMFEIFNIIEKKGNHIILCAKENEKVVGSVLGVICHELIGKCTPFLVIEDVAVLTSHRRLGIAKKLILAMEREAKSNNCNMILFVSSAHREVAHKLYESLGYGIDQVNGYRKRL